MNVVYALITAAVLYPFARLGRWRELAATYRKGRPAAPVPPPRRSRPPKRPTTGGPSCARPAGRMPPRRSPPRSAPAG